MENKNVLEVIYQRQMLKIISPATVEKNLKNESLFFFLYAKVTLYEESQFCERDI